MSRRSTLALLIVFATLGGCLIPDDYDPCHGPCPGPPLPDTGPPRISDAGVLLGAALEPASMADDPPPALSGGTLLVLHTAGRAVLGDPDTDTLHVIDTMRMARTGQLALASHDEPGRLVEDGAGRVHVVLRGAGAIATIDVSDPHAPSLVARRSVCPAPRGIAYDPVGDMLYVACAGGELVTLPPLGAPNRTTQLADDLRDVVIGSSLFVTRFRSAEVIVVDPSTGTATSMMPFAPVASGGESLAPSVAWRALAAPDRALFVLHQISRSGTGTVDGGVPALTCAGATVQTRLTRTDARAHASGVTIPCAVLAIDAAISPDGTSISVAIAGAAPLDPCRQVLTYSLDHGLLGALRTTNCTSFTGRVVAVAYREDGVLLAQTRAPLAVVSIPITGVGPDVQLNDLVVDTGFDAFHSSTSNHVACASCHPEGGDDGLLWRRADGDARRTIPLRGGLLATAPFDWRGERATFELVMSDVFTREMHGGELTTGATLATGHWLDAQRALPPRTIHDAEARVRGRTLFEGPLDCATCHSGPRFSDQSTRDVGTGGAFQVPSLSSVGYHAPFFHDGCAASLGDVIGTCARGAAHDASARSDGERSDLIAYLDSL